MAALAITAARTTTKAKAMKNFMVNDEDLTGAALPRDVPQNEQGQCGFHPPGTR